MTSAIRRKLIGLFAIAAISAPVAIAAQDLTQILPPPLLRMVQARDNFLGPDYWTDPSPATYLVKSAGSEMCLTWKYGAIRAQMPYLRLAPCNGRNADQQLQLSPAAVDTPPIPGTTNVRWRVTHRNECAGVARNVWIGAPRVDFNPCGMPAFTGGDATFRGDRDQHVIMVRVSQDHYRFRTDDGRCWTVDGAIQPDTELKIQPCDGRPGQVFTFDRMEGLFDQSNQEAATRFGWIDIGTHASFTVPNRFRRLSGLDMPGSDYMSRPTENDRGVACARACAADSNCRAFTWVQAGAQRAEAMCWFKDGIPAPVPNGDTVSGILRP